MDDNDKETPLQQPKGDDDQESVRYNHEYFQSYYRFAEIRRQLYADWSEVELDENNNEIQLQQPEGGDDQQSIRDIHGDRRSYRRFIQIQLQFCAQLRAMMENAVTYSSDSD